MIRHPQPGQFTIADRYAVGVYCGERLTSIRSWKRYGGFRRVDNGFSVGPILFWWKVDGKW